VLAGVGWLLAWIYVTCEPCVTRRQALPTYIEVQNKFEVDALLKFMIVLIKWILLYL